MKVAATLVLTVPALLAAAVAAAIAFGGPASIAPLASINEPFAHVDFSGVPPLRRYTARDGTALAWYRYAPAGPAQAARRVVLVHGSSARAQSLHPLARALAAAGFEVAALDMRGHGQSGPRGTIAYVGQLEDDIEDFVRAVPFAGSDTLMGFSSGGGFVLRFAGGERQQLFGQYVLLAPYLRFDAPTARPDAGGWASVGLPRIIGLRLANALGIAGWNHLPVVRFGLNEDVQAMLTPSYSYALATNFAPRHDYQADIRATRGPLLVIAGRDDELFHAERYAATFAEAGRAVPVTLIPGIGHMGLTLDERAVREVALAVRAAAPASAP